MRTKPPTPEIVSVDLEMYIEVMNQFNLQSLIVHELAGERKSYTYNVYHLLWMRQFAYNVREKNGQLVVFEAQLEIDDNGIPCFKNTFQTLEDARNAAEARIDELIAKKETPVTGNPGRFEKLTEDELSRLLIALEDYGYINTDQSWGRKMYDEISAELKIRQMG